MTDLLGIKTATRATHSVLAVCLAFAALAGCGDAGDPAAPRGPANGIIDVDVGSIPLGEGGAAHYAGGNSVSGNEGGRGAVVGNTGGASGAAPVVGVSSGGAGSSTLPPARGVSTPCSLDSDCAAPLFCRFDSADYIAAQQCTKACNSDEECSAALGKDSFCIGARICVHACKSDADCVAKTHCNDSRWCERGGPGSGLPYCAGIATPCSALSDLECISARGCTNDAACSGSAHSCYSQIDSYSCTSIQGCYWSSSSKSCSGSARSCSSQSGSFSCANQPGCYWSGGCKGVPDSCAEQLVSLCSNQPGCSLRTD